MSNCFVGLVLALKVYSFRKVATGMKTMHKFLQREVAESKKKKRTTMDLRRFAIGVVDQALGEHYGDNYSIRCFQGSQAIKAIHDSLGIKCKVWSGHVCLSRVTVVERHPHLGWAGFWDQDHHAWAINEYAELVDVSIAHLHLHPASGSKADLPIPPVWWDQIEIWPPTMVYMPEGLAVAQFDEEKDVKDLEKFLALVQTRFGEASKRPAKSRYDGPVLAGPSALNELSEQGHPWAAFSSYAQNLPKPPWVVNRINELNVKAQERSAARNNLK
jgi:hypothetical protein